MILELIQGNNTKLIETHNILLYKISLRLLYQKKHQINRISILEQDIRKCALNALFSLLF